MAISEGQLIRIRILFEVLGERFAPSLDHAIENFQHDGAPEREIQLFERACATFLVSRRENGLCKDALWSVLSDILLGKPEPRGARYGLRDEEIRRIYDTFFSL